MTPSPARVLVFASGKGGTSKTTLSLALADVWAETGARVALVDADPQAGLTTAAGCEPPADPLEAEPVAVHGVTLYRAGRALAAASVEAHRDRIAAAAAAADVVLVDCSPALTDAAHVAALSLASIVIVCARTDAAGLRNAEETVQLAAGAGVPVAVVPTFRTGTGLSREAEGFLRGRYGDRVTRATFPNDARAAEAAGSGKPVTRTAKRSKAADAVRAIGAELAENLSFSQPLAAP